MESRFFVQNFILSVMCSIPNNSTIQQIHNEAINANHIFSFKVSCLEEEILARKRGSGV